MSLPRFTAELALAKSTRTYRGTPRFGSFSQSAEPSISVQPSQMDAEGLGVPDVAGLMGAEAGDEDAEGLAASAGADEAEDMGGDEGDDDSAGEDGEGVGEM
jgi:hypothetical protein